MEEKENIDTNAFESPKKKGGFGLSLFKADPSPMMSTNSPGFKLGGMIKLYNTSSEESEP